MCVCVCVFVSYSIICISNFNLRWIQVINRGRFFKPVLNVHIYTPHSRCILFIFLLGVKIIHLIVGTDLFKISNLVLGGKAVVTCLYSSLERERGGKRERDPCRGLYLLTYLLTYSMEQSSS